MKRHIFSILFLLFLVDFSFAIDKTKPLFEQEPVQSLVQDYTQFLTEKQDQKLNQKLNTLSRETSTQILFVTVDNLFGYDKNDYATRLGEAWGIGGKEDNGVVILVLPKSAKHKGQVAIQVGYGLEGLIPDVVAKRIVEHEIIPNFKKGKYYRGIDASVDVITSLTKGKFTADTYLARNKGRQAAESENWLPFIFFIFFFIFFIILRSKSGRHQSMGSNLPFWIAMGMMGSSRGHGGGFSDFSSGGGSFGGGGFGGFGGGSFGGGGAGGSW